MHRHSFEVGDLIRHISGNGRVSRVWHGEAYGRADVDSVFGVVSKGYTNTCDSLPQPLERHVEIVPPAQV